LTPSTPKKYIDFIGMSIVLMLRNAFGMLDYRVVQRLNVVRSDNNVLLADTVGHIIRKFDDIDDDIKFIESLFRTNSWRNDSKYKLLKEVKSA